MRTRLRKLYVEFPSTFWTLIGATFIDRLGGALLFPFFALYITSRFDVGMTEVGVLFAIFAGASVAGGLLGGALTDKLGRRWMLIFGIVFSAASSLLMGVVDNLNVFYALAALVGLLAEAGGPAQQAMIADLLPEDKRAQGYGISRVAANLAVAIGPAIGGFIAGYSYLLLFVIDAVTSLITAVIVYFTLPETKPAKAEGQADESLLRTLRGYQSVISDKVFMAFFLFSAIGVLIYVQMNSSLSVYLRDVHGVPAQGFGAILSLNAAMVVLFQFPITRRIGDRPPLLMMALGATFYGVGYTLYGVVATFPLFLVAMAIITVGEMIWVPVAQALVAHFAPEDKRGRYMAFYGFTWALGFAIGPLLAGLIMDNGDPDWVWYASGLLSIVVVLGLLWLNQVTQVTATLPQEADG